jgi:hypothetical protein
MKQIADLLVVLFGGGALGAMMNSLPDYNSSFQPFSVEAAANGVGQGRLFTAELTGLKSAGAISFVKNGATVIRDTSAVFLVAELTIGARRESRQVEAIWLGATGRQYSQSVRVEDAPHTLSPAWFQPGLSDKILAVFELPDDEIVGGRLALTARGDPILDSAVHFASPATAPEKQDILRLEP